MAIHHPHDAGEHLGYVCESCERMESRLTEIEIQLLFITESMVYAAAEAIQAIEKVAEEAIEEIGEVADDESNGEGGEPASTDDEDSGDADDGDGDEEASSESGPDEISPDVPLSVDEPVERESRSHSFLDR